MPNWLLFLVRLTSIAALDLECREQQLSVPVDLGARPPEFVLMRYVAAIGSNLYDVHHADADHIRIGDVLEDGVLIYADSPSLVRRSVMNVVGTSFRGTLVKIYSVYRLRGADVREVVEFIREPSELVFRELVRRPCALDLRPGALNSAHILAISVWGRKWVRYDIGSSEKHRYMIGIVRYGEAEIDRDVVSVMYKGVTAYRDGSGKLVVEVVKMNKAADLVRLKCVMELDERGRDYCREIDVKVEPFW